MSWIDIPIVWTTSPSFATGNSVLPEKEFMSNISISHLSLTPLHTNSINNVTIRMSSGSENNNETTVCNASKVFF